MQCKPCSERVLSVKNEKGGREGRRWIGKISVRVEPRITGEVARERNKRIAASHPVTQSAATWREERMMMAPQVVGVLLKKPGQTSHSRIPPLDPQENKIRGELYVEELGERRIVCIRMGWLWVEGTSMRLPLRALNLRQAPQSHCQPHALALGFTLSNSQGDSLATFWADAEPIYWSWVRAIAAELVRQTPFRAQRCLNFLEILTICPRGPIPLPSDSPSPADSRRRSKSELRNHHRHRNHWSNDNDDDDDVDSPAKARFGRGSCILEETSLRRRARSELRGWSSSNSSDEDLPIDFHKNGPKSNVNATGTWGCSESSEGSDDSLPWGGNPCRSSIDSVDYVATSSRLPPALETREQRIQKYKEVRRRENEARSRKVLEEDARRKKAEAEAEAEAVASTAVTITKPGIAAVAVAVAVAEPEKKDDSSTSRVARKRPPTGSAGESSSVRFSIGVKVDSNGNEIDDKDTDNARESCGERRSRARERRSRGTMTLATHVSKAARKPSEPSESRIPIKISEEKFPSTSEKSSLALSIFIENPKEEDVARLLERCQRVDRYVPVRDKLTLFESLSRLGGRLARSTEDLGRLSSTKPSSPRGKQRARSLHDLNRAVRTVPVREMCRFFEGGDQVDANYSIGNRTDRTIESPPKRDNALIALSSVRLTRARISQRVSEKIS